MAITYFDSASDPADTGTQVGDANAGAGPTVTPPASMLDGDLVLLMAEYRGVLTAISQVVGGSHGQSFTQIGAGNENAAGTGSMRVWWARFNGTWGANPSVSMGTAGASVIMHVFRPSAGANTWAVDVAGSFTDFTAPSSPFTVTITGQTTVASSTVTLAAWATSDDNTWDTLSGTGWVSTGTAQYRNVAGQDMSATFAHYISTAPSTATGNVSKNQATLGGDAGMAFIVTMQEISADTVRPYFPAYPPRQGPYAVRIRHRGVPILPNIAPEVAVSVALTGESFTATPGSFGVLMDVALTTALATASPGTLAPTSDVPLVGEAATATPGTLTLQSAVALTGEAFSATAGTLGVLFEVPLLGTSFTAVQGTLVGSETERYLYLPPQYPPRAGPRAVQLQRRNIPILPLVAYTQDISIALSGEAIASAQGSLGVLAEVPIAGIVFTAAQGTTGVLAEIPLSGASVAAATGLVVPTSDVALSGAAATASPGTMGVTSDVPLTGASIASAMGTLLGELTEQYLFRQPQYPPRAGPRALRRLRRAVPSLPIVIVTGDVNVALTGAVFTATPGTLGVTVDVALSGQGATAAPGTLSPALAAALNGLVATTAAGVLTPESTVALVGQSATLAAGTLTPSFQVALSGLLASMTQGTLDPAILERYLFVAPTYPPRQGPRAAQRRRGGTGPFVFVLLPQTVFTGWLEGQGRYALWDIGAGRFTTRDEAEGRYTARDEGSGRIGQEPTP